MMSIKKGGCILLNEDKTKIALVYREKHDDYSFPKGHLELNETIIECALRETEEETGRTCHLLSDELLGMINYKNKKEGKIEVSMYLAIDDGKSSKLFKEEDMETLVWVNIDEVLDYLTYDNLKEFWLSIKSKVEHYENN